MRGPVWREEAGSAPAKSRVGRHVKSGSCDIPLLRVAGRGVSTARARRGRRVERVLSRGTTDTALGRGWRGVRARVCVCNDS